MLSFLFSFEEPVRGQEIEGETSEADHREEVKQDSIVQDSTEEKGFFGRIIDYFHEAKKDKTREKDVDFSIIGGPFYTKNMKFGAAIVGSGQYRLDKEDMSIPPSDASLTTSVSTAGFFNIGAHNTTIFPGEEYRLTANVFFSYRPRQFYGIGYQAGESDKHTKVDEYQVGGQVEFLKKIYKDAFVGVGVKGENIQGKNFRDKDFEPDEGGNNTRVGPGYILSYDSRDFLANPRKGVYLNFEHFFYPKALGSSHWSQKIDFSGRVYHQFWESGIVAFEINGIFQKGHIPWNMMSLLGSGHRMRGYYFGRYSDKDQINTQVEIRQKIKNRHGVAVWAGAGAVFESMDKWDWNHVLPTYGIGYRWEFKNRVNVRLDYGIGKGGQSGFYFGIKEAF